MLRFMVPALVAGLLALPATAAHADDPTYQCGMDVVQNHALTGAPYTGVGWGYAVHAGTTPVNIRCVVTINGTDVDEPEFHVDNPGHGVTYGTLGFLASPDDVVRLCAVVTTVEHGTQRFCRDATNTQFPPQEVIDAVCDVTSTVGQMGFDILGVVKIEPDGDVIVGVTVWDCGGNSTTAYRFITSGGPF